MSTNVLGKFKHPLRSPFVIASRLSELKLRLGAIARNRPYRYLGDNQALIDLHDGSPFVVDTQSLDLSTALIRLGRWESWIEPSMLKPLRAGGTFVDAGASMGYYTVLAAKRVGPRGAVFSFEPNSRIYQILVRNRFINGVRAEAYNFALGSKAFQTKLWVPGDSTGGGYITNDQNAEASTQGCKGMPVDVMPLDDVLPKDVTVDVMKIDVEGYEPEVLIGAQKVIERSRGIRLVIEFRPSGWVGQGHNPTAVLTQLVHAGFRFTLLRADGAQAFCSIPAMLEQAETVSETPYILAQRIA
jgi:FkbM family methyltransferase